MKEINLISFVQAFNKLDEPTYRKYFDYFNVNPKNNELVDLELFAKKLRLNCRDIDIFNNYFFGYTIPQISKEFDLLRFGSNYTVNVELKSINTGDKYWTREKRWIQLIKEAGCEEYLYEEKTV